MDAEQLVALIRDLAIIVFIGFGVLALVVTTVLAVLIYRKVVPLLDTTRATMKQAQEVSARLSEKVVKPLIGASTFAYGAGRVIGFILGLSRGKGGRRDGER